VLRASAERTQKDWNQSDRIAQEVRGGLRHYDLHDCFAVACAGNTAGLRVGVAATANQR